MKHKKLIRIKLKHTDLRRIRYKKQTTSRANEGDGAEGHGADAP